VASSKLDINKEIESFDDCKTYLYIYIYIYLPNGEMSFTQHTILSKNRISVKYTDGKCIIYQNIIIDVKQYS